MSATPNDGGPAFPQPWADNPEIVADCPFNASGMTLRDYFAAAALQGWLASYGSTDAHPCKNETSESVASQSYQMADAMLAARERKEDA